MERKLNDDKIQEWLDKLHQEKSSSVVPRDSSEGHDRIVGGNYKIIYKLLSTEDTPALDAKFADNLMQKVEAWEGRKSRIKSAVLILTGICFSLPFLYYFVGAQQNQKIQGTVTSWFTSILSPFNQDYLTGLEKGFQSLNMNIPAFILAVAAAFIIFLFDEFIIHKKKNIFRSHNMISF